MSTDFLILIVAVLITAYAATIVLRRKLPRWAAVAAVAVYTFLGVYTVLLAWLTGEGLVLPGRQLSPGVRSYYLAEVFLGYSIGLDAAVLFLAVVAHLVVAAPRPDRAGLVWPLPATLAFVGFFFFFQAREQMPPIRYQRALLPAAVAYVSVAPDRDGAARVVFAHGGTDDTFLKILHLHETRSDPPAFRLFWTNDGAGLVVDIHGERLFAIDLDGNVTGALPVDAHEWPRGPDTYKTMDVRRRFSQARRDVAEFVVKHGGIYTG